MPEQEEVLDTSEEEAAEPTDPKDAKIAALEKDLRAERGKARTAEAARLQALYSIEVSPEDLKGTNVATLEKLLQQVKAAAPQTEAPKVTPEQQEVRDAAKEFTSKDVSGAPATATTITFAEAKKMGGFSNPEVRKLIQQGLVEGVAAPNR